MIIEAIAKDSNARTQWASRAQKGHAYDTIDEAATLPLHGVYICIERTKTARMQGYHRQQNSMRSKGRGDRDKLEIKVRTAAVCVKQSITVFDNEHCGQNKSYS